MQDEKCVAVRCHIHAVDGHKRGRKVVRPQHGQRFMQQQVDALVRPTSERVCRESKHRRPNGPNNVQQEGAARLSLGRLSAKRDRPLQMRLVVA